MNYIQQILQMVGNLFTWWFVAMPWEQAVRVRLGKWVKHYKGGVHLRIPYIDAVFMQNTRKRVSSTSAQTLSTKDLKAVTLQGALNYRIEDVLALYRTLHQAEETLQQEVQGILSKFILTHRLEECKPQSITEYVNSKLDFEKYGLVEVKFFLTDFAHVKTHRFITGGITEGWTPDELNTIDRKGK